ncbi:hypothetical protein, partial [uncultured Nocardioides sp.]|uniref:hypothetical protein n=1 Tax=uncultured Nocardioides sp. TaxID=198441 RepID=UPI002601617E
VCESRWATVVDSSHSELLPGRKVQRAQVLDVEPERFARSDQVCLFLRIQDVVVAHQGNG